MLRFRNETSRFENDFGESERLSTGNFGCSSSYPHPATLIWCHLVYLRERRENGKEMDFRRRNDLANNLSSGKETLSSEAPMV